MTPEQKVNRCYWATMWFSALGIVAFAFSQNPVGFGFTIAAIVSAALFLTALRRLR